MPPRATMPSRIAPMPAGGAEVEHPPASGSASASSWRGWSAGSTGRAFDGGLVGTGQVGGPAQSSGRVSAIALISTPRRTGDDALLQVGRPLGDEASHPSGRLGSAAAGRGSCRPSFFAHRGELVVPGRCPPSPSRPPRGCARHARSAPSKVWSGSKPSALLGRGDLGRHRAPSRAPSGVYGRSPQAGDDRVSTDEAAACR